MTKEEKKRKKIDSLYNILIQYEKIGEDNTTMQSYLACLDSLRVKFTGQFNGEIAKYLDGLFILGDKANHETVRRIILKVINIVDKS